MNNKLREWIIPMTSLAVAFTALWYNTWRNETTEQNRNVRAAGFEIIKELSALQLVANHAHYDHDSQKGDLITGWSHILLIEDLAMVMPSSVQKESIALHEQWETHVGQLTENEMDNDAVIAEIALTKAAVLQSLKKLH